MSCPCDTTEFPPRLYIPAGLTRLPRQPAAFPEFRAALLQEIGRHPALSAWRGRQGDDFGVMLLEMWAYVADVTSFYDEVLAHETYLRTARQRASLRRLVGLLGYLPRPAVGASVELAALAAPPKAVSLPAGIAFRSGAFSGNPPQVFELTGSATIHARSNEWELEPVRPTTFGPTAIQLTALLCAPGSVSAKLDDLVLLKAGNVLSPAIVTRVADHTGYDGARYSRVEFDRPVSIPANTAISGVRILRPASHTPITPLDHSGSEEHTYNASPAWVYLDSVYRSIRSGQNVILEYNRTFHARTVTGVDEVQRVVTAASTVSFTPSGGTATSVTVPAANTPLTKLSLDGGVPDLTASCGLDIVVHFAFVPAGTVTMEALTSLSATDPLPVPSPVVAPADALPPSRFQLEDANGKGLGLRATLVYPTGRIQPDQGTVFPAGGLATPIRAYGNILSATRGETVAGESLGSGDAAVPSQEFPLKKSPLTYLPAPSEGNASGLASTLTVYVDGLRWAEVPTFYGQPAEAEVYVVRQDDEGKSRVIFGDGVRGRRLPTGAAITASYRFGAGAAMPPPGSIHQLARPVAGLRAIRNPVAAFGGADAEPAKEMRRYAPRSALLLGRAVSLADLEAAAAAVGGVRAVRADWRWNPTRLRPCAQIHYLGDRGIEPLITQRLRGLAEEDLPLDVGVATPLVHTLAIQVEIDPSYLEADVLAAVRSALMDPDSGLLAPERVGIGLPLFRSRILEFVLRVPGAISVPSLRLDNVPFATWAISPGAGNYFDFENGSLLLNGD